MTDILFQFGDLRIQASFNDSSTAQIIASALPIESRVNRWGDEIYFEIPAKLPPEQSTVDLNVGDIAYWPEGSCLCLFFGRTPASIDERPRPASDVNIVGRFSESAEPLRKVAAGATVRVMKR